MADNVLWMRLVSTGTDECGAEIDNDLSSKMGK